MSQTHAPLPSAAPGPPALEPGDIAPTFILPAEDGKRTDLAADDIAGNFVVLVFCSRSSGEASVAQLRGFATLQARFDELGARVFAVTSGPPAANAAVRRELGLPFPFLSDTSGVAFGQYGVRVEPPSGQPGMTTSFVIGPNRHLLQILRDAAPAQGDAALRIILERAAERRPVAMGQHPPVLIVPDVLSRADCQRLIAVFTMTGNEFVEPGHGDPGRATDFKMKVPDYERQDRVDHWIMTAETNRFVDARLRHRLLPEIKKAFQYDVTRREHYRIGCYQGERGGEAHAHRDNSLSIGAHRRFAVSINLNTEEFEGGELRFPEFGDQRYRPATGAAIAFSSSLLHEALHVTSGRRYVLLGFLFGDR